MSLLLLLRSSPSSAAPPTLPEEAEAIARRLGFAAEAIHSIRHVMMVSYRATDAEGEHVAVLADPDTGEVIDLAVNGDKAEAFRLLADAFAEEP